MRHWRRRRFIPRRKLSRNPEECAGNLPGTVRKNPFDGLVAVLEMLVRPMDVSLCRAKSDGVFQKRQFIDLWVHFGLASPVLRKCFGLGRPIGHKALTFSDARSCPVVMNPQIKIEVDRRLSAISLSSPCSDSSLLLALGSCPLCCLFPGADIRRLASWFLAPAFGSIPYVTLFLIHSINKRGVNVIDRDETNDCKAWRSQRLADMPTRTDPYEQGAAMEDREPADIEDQAHGTTPKDETPIRQFREATSVALGAGCSERVSDPIRRKRRVLEAIQGQCRKVSIRFEMPGDRRRLAYRRRIITDLQPDRSGPEKDEGKLAAVAHCCAQASGRESNDADAAARVSPRRVAGAILRGRHRPCGPLHGSSAWFAAVPPGDGTGRQIEWSRPEAQK